jgi:hypothetical protein
MRQPNSKRLLIVAGMLVVALLAVWLWLRGTSPAGPPTGSTISQSGNTNTIANTRRNWEEKLREAAANLAGGPDAAGKSEALARLRKTLAAGSTNEVSAAIRAFLDSKVDAPTRQGFKVGKHGFLTEAPTLRAWLLDYLAQIDPAAAAEYARAILNTSDSPDEWALALRNLALGDTSADARALMEEKIGELLNNQDWQQNSSAGYLEAFDTAVYLGSTNFVPTLAGLVSLQNNPALAHAAFLALDRMVINDPTAMLSALLAQPNLMPGRDQVRADYFARADVGNPQQLDLVQNYLLNPQTSDAELQQFAGIFPNANFMVSPNLLTQSPDLDQTEIKNRDVESLKVVQQWLGDPRFAHVQPELAKIQVRLLGFVRQASQQ